MSDTESSSAKPAERSAAEGQRPTPGTQEDGPGKWLRIYVSNDLAPSSEVVLTLGPDARRKFRRADPGIAARTLMYQILASLNRNWDKL